MAETLRHRGPDDSGEWVDPSSGIALGFRRLSIVDLSPAGHQPMESACGRYVIVFNGEMYNFQELREDLEHGGQAPPFRGHSDTEVLLAAVTAWGLETAVRRTVGMFAFALWDREDRVLSLVRDRVGIKPLYYGWQGATFLFASELKAIRAHPAFRNEVDRDSLTLLLRHGYIPAPYSIYKGIRKLLPGSILRVCGCPDDRGCEEPRRYWSAREVVRQGKANPWTGTEEEAIERLDVLLKDAVRLRMVADVPLGAFLSGGVDSSAIVSLMQAQSSRPVKTFCIGFHDKAFDEAGYAAAVARRLGTDHLELYVSPEDARSVIYRLPELYDEPLADSSQIPTFLVSQLARQQVTVSLSGDGGDELFGGYNRYRIGGDLWGRMGRVPAPVRRAAASVLAAAPSRLLDQFKGLAGAQMARYGRLGSVDGALRRLSEMLSSSGRDSLYHNMMSYWKRPEAIVPGSREPETVFTDSQYWPGVEEFGEQMLYVDLVSYLVDDILAKVDRASMGVSLEVRVPLLDHRVVEFAWQLPIGMKLRDGEGKWILRKLLDRYVPRDLIDRPKMGFTAPIAEWLRGPMRDWAEALLDERRLDQEGFFTPGPIGEKWREHLSGARDWQFCLWSVLMFQAWRESQGRVSG